MTAKNPKKKKPAKKKTPKKRSPKKKATHKPKLSGLHSGQCKVCNHPDLKDIEAAYMAGGSTYAVAKMFKGLNQSNIQSHVSFLGLNRQRKYSSLDRIEAMLDRYDNFGETTNAPPSEQLVGQLIKLRAQIRGELVEKREETIDVKLKIKIAADKMLENLAKRLGVSPGEVQLIKKEETNGDAT